MDNRRSIQQATSEKTFMFYREVMGQSDPSAFLGNTVQCTKSKKDIDPNFVWCKLEKY